jgi:hypothetical protein
LLSAVVLLTPAASLGAQRAPNQNPFYQQLRGLLPGGEVISVKHLELHRDAATFTFAAGDIAFFGEVNGKVTGAVFKGEGHFHLTPPNAQERHSISVYNHADEYDEDFDQVVLRFTDGTAAELHKGSAGKGADGSAYAAAARDMQHYQRVKLQDNQDLRLLQDVLSPSQGGFFCATIHGKKNSHLIFTVDPYGAGDLAPEEVTLVNWNDWGPAFISSFPSRLAGPEPSGVRAPNEPFRIERENLDVTIEKGGLLSGLATLRLLAEQDGVAVVPLNLYATLRVSRVETDKGEALDFVQEKKDEDADFGVILAKPLMKGESTTLRVTYGGKDVVRNEGNDNYYPLARQSWYPNATRGLGNYATYQMLFRVPKGLQLIATGTRLSEKTEGKFTISEWKTDVPMAVIGFNLGRFTMKEAKVAGKLGDDLIIDAYANSNPPDSYAHLNAEDDLPIEGGSHVQEAAIGSINTASMLPVQLSQGEVAARIYTDYFGPLPFAKVALTQQFACNYGQSWPMLVYLPICGFLDQTQQHVMGLHPEDMYWKVVTPHEVAHQWWGQTVGFGSYRDQWMSEGFANTSASIFLQLTRPKPDDFREFWKEQRKLITEKNSMGFRPIDVGPVTMGFRLSSQKTGWNIYQNLVYPKGAYILHMIRMMMWSPKDGDARFIATMHDLLASYRLKAATTEDFKAVVEKHMSPGMDLDGNGKMDWFFNQYVYGTELPAYHFEAQVTPTGDGSSVHFKLTQSGVSDKFKMLAPIYLELAEGRTIRLGMVPLTGSTTIERTVPVPKLSSAVKKASIDYLYDVLSIDN